MSIFLQFFGSKYEHILKYIYAWTVPESTGLALIFYRIIKGKISWCSALIRCLSHNCSVLTSLNCMIWTVWSELYDLNCMICPVRSVLSTLFCPICSFLTVLSCLFSHIYICFVICLFWPFCRPTNPVVLCLLPWFVCLSVFPPTLSISSSVADPDPGSRIRDPMPFWSLDLGSGMGEKSWSGSRMNNPDHISESIETIFWDKILKNLWCGSEIWHLGVKNTDSWSGMQKIRIRDPVIFYSVFTIPSVII
jgi:hypothetical protein